MCLFTPRLKSTSDFISKASPIISPVRGQLVDPCPLKTGVQGVDTTIVKTFEGFRLYSYLKKSELHRTQRFDFLGYHFLLHLALSRARQVDKTLGKVPSPLHKVCYECKDSYVKHWIACINRLGTWAGCISDLFSGISKLTGNF